MDTRRPNAWQVGGLDAAALGDLAGAKALWHAGKWCPGHAVDKHGSTALMYAAGGDHLEVVRWLLCDGDPVEAEAVQEPELQPEPVDVNAANKEGRTALMWACKMAAASTAAYLLALPAVDPTATMKSGSDAFAWAVFGGSVPIMELVAAQPAVNISATNHAGCSAIMWASSAGRVDVLRRLLAYGLEFGQINAHGQGCVNKAAWFGHAAAVHWLLCCDDGPALGAQLALVDKENGLTVGELTHCAGHFAVGCWLGVLAAAVAQAEAGVGVAAGARVLVGTALPAALLEGRDPAAVEGQEQAQDGWLPWREEMLLRVAFELEQGWEQAGEADAAAASGASAAAAARAAALEPLTPRARQWRKATLLAARAICSAAAETTEAAAAAAALGVQLRTPVAQALYIAHPDLAGQAMAALQLLPA